LTYANPQQALLASYRLSQLNIVVYAHPNFIIPKEDRSSNSIQDSYFQDQWHLENTKNNAGSPGADIKARQAWEITEGSSSITIAIIDGGFDVEHKDLKNQWHINSKEIPNNNKDDDRNGLVDDYYGWDFARKYGYLRNKPNHGTAVAGSIAAEKNGVGTIGSCPLCKILPIVHGSTPFEDAEAFYYAKQRGAVIISNSWGYPIGTPNTPAVVNAINDIATNGRGGKGIVIFFAMTNSHRDNCTGDKPDISSLPNVISISGSDHNDQRVYGSGYGKCLKLLAPTRKDSSSKIGIVTTDVTGRGGYNFFGGTTELADFDYTKNFSGTSASTPIAAGVAGLLLANEPQLSRQEVLTRLINSADKIEPAMAKYNSSGFSESHGFGRINAFKALQFP
ncbi:MAG: S8 family serine peptidase, partial [Oligoflexales bacterium]|nr:S8 family serine peptidase [Oligoflexales bacterium]